MLYRFSAYAVPVILAILSAIALGSWDRHYPTSKGRELTFRAVAEQADSPLSPSLATARLRDAPAAGLLDNRLAEIPFWVAIPVGAGTPDGLASQSVEFPSRHANELTCWNADTLAWLGHATRAGTTGALAGDKAGYMLSLASVEPVRELLCRATFVGPARMTVRLWRTDDLAASSMAFHRNAGLLEGGLVVLALFVLITALINRNGMYIVFAAWLLVNLRMGAISAGWDAQWLGRTIPAEWRPRLRLITLATYYTLTVTLFRELFREDLRKIGRLAMLRFTQWTCLPLVAASTMLPYPPFLLLIWVVTGLNVGVMVLFLARILASSRSRVAMWYTASIATTLFATMYEILAAALGLHGLTGTVNSVTAALSSSLLASLAIAEQMRLEHLQRVAAQDELTHSYEAMPIGLFTLDLDGRFTSANAELRRMLGRDVLKPGGPTWHQCFEDGAWTRLLGMARPPGSDELEIAGSTTDASADGPRRYLVRAALTRDRIEGSLQDVTEKSLAAEELRFMADYDSLTRVLNRRGIEKLLDTLSAGATGDAPLMLAYLDLDRFKLINDLFGHNAGDEVLRQVCTRAAAVLADDMRIGRIGGDEFLIAMPGIPMSVAALICRRILDSIGSASYRVADKAFHVRASIGLIEIAPGTPIKDAVSTADRACREAKAGHGDGLAVYEKSTQALREHEAQMRLVEQLSTHTAMQGLYLEMQPIMSLRAPRASLNFEMLLRMREADGKPVPTARLIAAGENSGRMGVIDRWVLSTALDWLDRHAARLGRTQFVCMNLSGASLNDEKFMHDVYAMLARKSHLTRLLCFEITESVALHDLANTRRFIDTVRGHGAKVALDDFGAGYTSFSYLKDLPADLLKIDGSFIVNMNADPANIAIVEAIVKLSHTLGMKTIAEWAEDLDTVRTLARIGVDYVQGYAIARPQAPEHLLAAESSAGFIGDEETARYVDLLEQADPRVDGRADGLADEQADPRTGRQVDDGPSRENAREPAGARVAPV